MKDFDIVKYLKENKQGAYGMFNGYVDLKPLKEEEESTPAEDTADDETETVPYEAEEDQLTGLGDSDEFEQDDVVSEEVSISENRLEDLIDRRDISVIRASAQRIFDDLTSDGFEADDVAKYLIDQIMRAAAPYKYNPLANAGTLSENEEYPDYTRIMDLGGEQIEQGIIRLLDDGFSEEDILELCKEFVEGQADMRAAEMGDESEFEAPEWQKDSTQNREFYEGKKRK